MNPQSTVRFWHAVELLQPQAIAKIKPRERDYMSYLQDIQAAADSLPWLPGNPLQAQALPPKRAWRHTLYAHLYENLETLRELTRLFGADQGYREPQPRSSALYALHFDHEGKMVVDSLVLSSEAWFVGCAVSGTDWTHGFDGTQDYLRREACTLLSGVVQPAELRAFTALVRETLGLDAVFGDTPRRHRVRSTPINPDKPRQEDDPLNSFLLDDLAHVAAALERGDTSVPLARYLDLQPAPARLHLDSTEADLALIDRLAPSRYAPGCWPSKSHLGLVHSQQLAVNTVLETLAHSSGLLGVNGPPGTGKTTLLRDLIAAVVTERADVLVSLKRASDAFIKDGREKAHDGSWSHQGYRLDPRLFGFEMVVASSNNGAVENITLELPQRDSIDPGWLPDAEYFGDLAELTSNGSAWGMISAALGSKSNRKVFVDHYYFGKPRQKKPPQAQQASDDEESDEVDLERDEDTGVREDASSANPSTVVKGMRQWFAEHKGMDLSSTEKAERWGEAVGAYDRARRAEQALRAQIDGILERLDGIRSANARIAPLEQQRDERLRARSTLNEDQLALESNDIAPTRKQLQQALHALEHHLSCKPGFFANLFSLWGAQRTWSTREGLLSSAHRLAQDAFDSVQRRLQRLQGQQAELTRQLANDEQAIDQAREHLALQVAQARALAENGQAQHLLQWLDTGLLGRDDDIELCEPWLLEGWRKARAQVFIEALKLHRTFLQIEATRLGANLTLMTSILAGNRFHGLSQDVIRSAWASLFMMVPVLSSTFASFARCFGTLGCGQIGWLLIDEAGQATPQAAVGALWRARRAVVVGDPLQLEPIVTVSDAVLERMRSTYQVDPHWLPSRQSAQTLADLATSWGRLAGPQGQKRWVGLPLVVHRRCDEPMFRLANRIAYDGAMVYGTRAPSAEDETRARFDTGWIDVRGPSSGNWVEREGMVLRRFLQALAEDGVPSDSIAVITPFQDVRDRLEDLLPKRMLQGTIHTMQGKEAAVIVLVLGGNSESPEARDWAVSKPNLLNVAVTRAKRRLFVIGDRRDWAGRRMFCEVMDLLPVLSKASVKAGAVVG